MTAHHINFKIKIYCVLHQHDKSVTFLQQITVRFNWIIMVTTKRSVYNFGYLIVGFYGSYVNF